MIDSRLETVTVKGADLLLSKWRRRVVVFLLSLKEVNIKISK
jgi:hypothetical protein